MLEGLINIDWDKLQHAYGPASDVPDQIRSLIHKDADTRSEAMLALQEAICHQGTVYEASAHAAPFLLELIAEDSTPGRAEILSLLGNLAGGKSYLEVHAAGNDPVAVKLRSDPYYRPKLAEELKWKDQTHAEIRNGIDLYLRLLTGPSPELRVTAAYVLSRFPELKNEIGSVIGGNVPYETDPTTRVGLLLSLIALGDESIPTREVFEWALSKATDERERYAAAVGLARTLKHKAPAKALVMLAMMAADSSKAEETFEDLPWDAAFDPSEPLAHVRSDANVSIVLPILLEGLNAKDPFVATDCAKSVVNFMFGKPPFPPCNQWTEPQRQAMQAIVDSDGAWERPNLLIVLHDQWMPGPRDSKQINSMRGDLRKMVA